MEQQINIPVYAANEITALLFEQAQKAELYLTKNGSAVIENYYDREELTQAVKMLRLTAERLIIKQGGCV